MSKKSTAPRTTTTTKSTAAKTSRKASATRTKLPAASPEVIEAMAPPAAIVEVAIAQPEVQPEAQPEVPEIIEAMAPPARTVTHEELTAMVRREAYLRAQRRGFRNGNPFEDWVLAEADVRATLANEGVSLPVA